MPEFETRWSIAAEGTVDSAFFWGYLFAQLPGGLLAAVYPANRVFGAAIAISASLNVIFPIVFKATTAHIVIILRLLQGLVEVILKFA